MKQVFQNPKSGKTRIEELLPPMLRSGGVLVKNNYSVISVGTERGIIELSKKSLFQKAKERPDYVQKFLMLVKTKGFKWAWAVAQSKLTTDIALGYSSAGEVVVAGREAEEFKAGDRVACAGQNYASHAEYIFAPKNLCAKIPVGVSEREAAFATVASIAMQGVRRAELTPGETVGVVGLGLLGQVATRILKAYGHPVIGFDINPAQVEFAKANGMTDGAVIQKGDYMNVVNKLTKGRGVDAALVYASAKTDEPLKLAVQICRDRGRVVQIGNIETKIPWRDFYAKDLAYYPSRSYGPGRYDPSYEEGGNDYPIGYVRWTEKRNMEEFLRLLQEHKISMENLVSRSFDVSEAEKAYALVAKPEGLIHGIVLTYPKSAELGKLIKLPVISNPVKTAGAKLVRIGLIGIGAFMKSEILPHLKKCTDMEIVGVANSKGLEAAQVAKAWGADYVTTDYHRLIDDKNIDLIICATRHSNHAQIAVEVLKANKNLYIEKPLALDEKELAEVMKAAENSEGRLTVGFNRRYSRHFEEAKKEFGNSKTPLMMLYRINYALENHWSHDPKEGGRLIGEGCHFVDALQFLCDSKPVRVTAAEVPVAGAVTHEENFSFTIEYENGSVGTVFYAGLGNFQVPKEYIEIYGDGEIMIIDNFKNGKIAYPNKVRTINLTHQHKGYFEELTAILEAIRNGNPSPMKLEDLYLSHLTIFKVAEALKTGGAVDLHY